MDQWRKPKRSLPGHGGAAGRMMGGLSRPLPTEVNTSDPEAQEGPVTCFLWGTGRITDGVTGVARRMGNIPRQPRLVKPPERRQGVGVRE